MARDFKAAHYLIYGLRLINEKEADLGLPLGSIKVDGNALAIFVASKGQQILKHHYQEDDAMTWTTEENEKVASEVKRQNPVVGYFEIKWLIGTQFDTILVTSSRSTRR